MRLLLVLTLLSWSWLSWGASPSLEEVNEFTKNRAFLDKDGRVTPTLQERIYSMEERFQGETPAEAYFVFQAFVGRVGGQLKYPPLMPPGGTSLWLRRKHKLSQFQSTPELPKHVGVVVIGSGLAGLGAAKKLGELYSQGQINEFVILDKNGVAEGASGHNGGNRQPTLERFINFYESLVKEREKFLKLAFPWMTQMELKQASQEQAKQLLSFGAKNSELMNQILEEFKIEADVSSEGWLRLSNRVSDERALEEDVKTYQEVGIETKMLEPSEVFQESGLSTPYKAKLTPQYGNYHPYEFITQAFEALLKQGALIYTQTEVTKIDWHTPQDQPVKVYTNRGMILADKVIVATDAFGSKLLPELSMIEPFQSHILLFDHVENKLEGRTITEWDGDLYYNGPKGTWYVDASGVLRMTLLVGGGPDQLMPDVDKPVMLKHSYEVIIEQITARYPELKNQPPSQGWTYGFGFTPDGAMVWGPLTTRENNQLVVDQRVFIAGGGSQGYGGATQIRAGYGAAEYVTSGFDRQLQVKTTYDPLNMFDMGRYFSKEYLESRSCSAIF